MGAGFLYDPHSFVSTSINEAVGFMAVTIHYRPGLLGLMTDERLYNEGSGNNNRSTTGDYGILVSVVIQLKLRFVARVLEI